MRLLLVATVATTLLPGAPLRANSNDVAAIGRLEAQFQEAVNAKDVNAIMKVYDPYVVVFDVVPPRQYNGAIAYRRDWQEFTKTLGPIKFTISDLDIDANGNLGFSHSIQSVTGKDAKGQPFDLVVRVTDIYRKTNGHWLIVHEHVSVPVDLDTKKPDLLSKP